MASENISAGRMLNAQVLKLSGRYRLLLRHEGSLAILNYLRHFSLEGIIQDLLLHDRVQQRRVGGINIAIQLGFEVAHLVDSHIVQHAASSSKDHQDLL